MDRRELNALLKLLRSHGVAEFTLDEDDTVLTVKFAGATPAAALGVATGGGSAAGISATAPRPTAAPAGDLRAIRAHIVGTFYLAPSPEAPAYVNVGDRVRKGQIVCIVEAMKLMNQIESDVDGVVVEILVENGQPVQFGQELFRLSPV